MSTDESRDGPTTPARAEQEEGFDYRASSPVALAMGDGLMDDKLFA
jgi:hypothetical protein